MTFVPLMLSRLSSCILRRSPRRDVVLGVVDGSPDYHALCGTSDPTRTVEACLLHRTAAAGLQSPAAQPCVLPFVLFALSVFTRVQFAAKTIMSLEVAVMRVQRGSF